MRSQTGLEKSAPGWQVVKRLNRKLLVGKQTRFDKPTRARGFLLIYFVTEIQKPLTSVVRL